MTDTQVNIDALLNQLMLEEQVSLLSGLDVWRTVSPHSAPEHPFRA